jgi:hypothetical protein
MAGGYSGDVEPVPGIEGMRGVNEHTPGGQGGAPRRMTLRGVVALVRRGAAHHNGQAHLLDVSVGGGEHSEITIRVRDHPPAGLEGRRVVIYLEDEA